MSQLPAGEDWRPEKSSGEVVILHCEECTVIPRGTDNTKIRYREYGGGSATQVYSGLGDYSTFPLKDDRCQKSCLQHSPCRQMRLSSQEWSGLRCSIVTSSKTRVDWTYTPHNHRSVIGVVTAITNYPGWRPVSSLKTKAGRQLGAGSGRPEPYGR